MKPAFDFQVNPDGVEIIFNPEVNFRRIKKELTDHALSAANFFSGVDLYVNIADCQFKIEQLQEIMDIIKKYNDVDNIFFTHKKKSNSRDTSRIRDTVLIKRTIRSGQQVKYPTNIVIIGDINPGSEVIAAGDIIVLGKVRGVVHAGAGGFNQAQVVAFKLEPTQLRIAKLITRPPEAEEKNSQFNPERAYIKESNIIVERLYN